MSMNKTPEQVWDEFLQRWPQQALNTMTLAQYAQGADEDCFSGCLRYLSDELGWRPGGGTHYPQIGVSALPATSLDTYRGNPKYGVDEPSLLGWLRELGSSAEEAFANTRARLCQIAEAAARGDVSVLAQPVLYDIYEWKLFFIYQNRQQPVLLPLQRLDDIPQWYHGKFGTWLQRGKRPKESDLAFALRCNQQLMAARDGLPVFDYVAQLKQLVEARYLAQESPQTDEGWTMPSFIPERKYNMPALNQILYGPPGTGKTYETVQAALAILKPELLNTAIGREPLKSAFDGFVASGQIVFTTFHQSFSYEDFVEGLRAVSDETTGQLRYEVADGVFKILCRRAQQDDPFEKSLQVLLDKVEQGNGRVVMKTVRGNEFFVRYAGGPTFQFYTAANPDQRPEASGNLNQVRTLYETGSTKGVNRDSYVRGMLNFLREHCGLPEYPATVASERKPYVLIIDEINRGNISRIFGELITLIEPSKRAGADEALSVTLPYSKETFSVPANVYIIGTMNTADRSLAGLDLALRRRFSFTEMPPRPELLDQVEVEGVNIGQMLRVMNQRITVLLDRDHTIGHAYFMPLQTTPTLAALADIFRQKILPLLQEYFFEDWERIRWVLNDQTKPDGVAFIIEDKSLEVSALFQGVADKLRQWPRWTLNDQAFAKADAYRGIAAKLDKGEA